MIKQLMMGLIGRITSDGIGDPRLAFGWSRTACPSGRIGFRGLLAATVIAGGIVLTVPWPTPAYAAGGWSAPTHLALGVGEGVNSVSCASATFCVVVDGFGDALNYDGSNWSTPTTIDPGDALASVSCPTASFCAAVGFDGTALTYNGTGWSAPVNIAHDSGGFPASNSVSCATASVCAAISTYGDALIYNGTGWSAPSSVDPSSLPQGTQPRVSCSSASFCAAVDTEGRALIYNGAHWSAPTRIQSSTAGSLASVSCASATFCVAVNQDGDALTYNGASWSGAVQIDQFSLDAVSCPTASFCAAVGGSHALTYNGTGWSTPSVPDPLHRGLAAVSCPTVRFCTALDLAGNALTYDGAAPTLVIAPSPLPVNAGPVPYIVTANGGGPTPTGSVALADGQGGTCLIDPITSGTGSCTLTERAGASPYTITATYSGDSNYSGTATSITVASGVSSDGTATSGIGGVTASATGGTDGADTVTTTPYIVDPVGSPTFGATGGYFDVVLSPGNTFSSDTITDCSLNRGSDLYWWDPSVGAVGGWRPVVGNPGPTFILGLPPCLSVTLDSSTSPSLAQLTGTVFGVAKLLGISTASLPSATPRVHYSATLAAVGGNHPYTWKLVKGSGKLPKGLKLNKATGVISGTPKRTGTSTFTIEVLDKKAKGTKGHRPTQNTDTRVLSITVS